MDTEQKEKMQKMVNAFQRDQGQDKEAQNLYSLDDLEALDTYIGHKDLNTPYRLAIQKRIAALKKQDDRKHESHIRALDTTMKIAIGIIVGWVLAKVL